MDKAVERYIKQECPRLESDERVRDRLTFYNPYVAKVLEGGSASNSDNGFEMVAILSSN